MSELHFCNVTEICFPASQHAGVARPLELGPAVVTNCVSRHCTATCIQHVSNVSTALRSEQSKVNVCTNSGCQPEDEKNMI